MVSACASATHRPVVDDAADRGLNGIRYYGTSIYVLVWSDGKGGLQTRIQELPDPEKKMVVDPRVEAGKLDLTLTFKDGMLTESSTNPDATEIPKQVVSAVETLAGILAGRGAGRPTQAFAAPYVFKLVTKEGHIEFIGSQADQPIRVPLPREEPAG